MAKKLSNDDDERKAKKGPGRSSKESGGSTKPSVKKAPAKKAAAKKAPAKKKAAAKKK